MAGGFSVTISAVDQATATIERVNKKLQSFNAPLERVNAQLAKFSRLSGLNDLAAGMNRLARSAVDVFRGITRIIAPLGAITGAASLAGMYRMSAAWAIWAQHQDITAKRIGLTSGKLQEFEGVAKLAGSSTEAMDGGLKALRDSMFAITANAASADTVTAFKRLGIDGDFAKNHLNDLSGAMAIILPKLRAIKDPTLQAAAAQGIFQGATESLIPLFNLTAEQYAAYTNQVRAHGLVTEQQTAKLRVLARSQDGLQMSVDMLGLSVAAAVSGPLADLLTGLSRWVDGNRDLIASKVDEYAQRFATWLKGVDWTAVGSGIKAFATEAGHLATEMEHALHWMDQMGVTAPLLGGILAAKLLGPLTGIVGKLALMGAWRMPGWIGAMLGLSGAAVTALGSTMLLRGDTPGAAAPDAVSVDEAQKRVDDINSKYGYNGRFLHDMGQGIRNLFSGGGGTPALPKGVTDQLARQAYSYYTAHGLSAQAAAGVVAGNIVESGMNARNLGDGGQAYGIGQWHPDRQAHFASMFGHPIQQSTFEEQLAFKLAELNGTGGDSQSAVAGALMRRPGITARQAGAADSLYAERPGDAAGNAQQRGALGERLYDLYNPKASGSAVNISPSAPSPGGSSDTPPPSGSATITVRHVNPPPGSVVTAQTSGTIFNGAPKIETSLPGVGGGME